MSDALPNMPNLVEEYPNPHPSQAQHPQLASRPLLISSCSYALRFRQQTCGLCNHLSPSAIS